MKFTIRNSKFAINPVTKRVTGLLALLCLSLAAWATPALAQGPTPDGRPDLTSVLPAALIFLMPLGLILLISSAQPEREAPAAAVKLLLVWAVAAVAYFGVGFAFHFGGIAQVAPQPDLQDLYWEWYPLDQSVEVEAARLWGVIALRGWALSGEAAAPGALLLFLSHLPLVGLAAIIPAGALLRRVAGIVLVLTGGLAGVAVYPLSGNWLWGGGWLSQVGASLGFGHGLVDFGGAGPVFLAGATMALMGLLFFRIVPTAAGEAEPADEVVVMRGQGSRLTVYNDEPAAHEAPEALLEATPMPSAYLPLLSLLGSGLLLFGWFGLSTGLHQPTAVNFSPALAATNGLLAALAAALAAGGYSWFTTREFNPLMTTRGMAAGLVVAVAGAPFMPAWLALAAGLLMGLLLPSLIYLFDQKWRLADRSGVLATYGLSALLGLLLVGLFADGRAGQGWNGVGLADYYGVAGQGVSGLLAAFGFVPDWPGQIQAQLLGAGAIIFWAILASFLLFQTAAVAARAWTRTGLELVDAGRRPTPTTVGQEPETSYDLSADPAEAEGREDTIRA